MNKKKHVFINGLHRSGTTWLHDALKRHPAVSGFSDTEAVKDEGQHLQSVYPTDEAYGGPGHFGFDPDMHLTESSDLLDEDNKSTLREEWNAGWDLSKPCLIEKSPSDLLRMRFLQEVFPRSRFITIIRHPVPVAYATQKWSRSTIHSLVEHWLVCYAKFFTDLPHIQNNLLISYEELIHHPDEVFSGISGFLDINMPCPGGLEDKNEAYFDRWHNSWINRLLFRKHRLSIRFEHLIRAFGYSLRDTALFPRYVRTGERPVR